MADVVVRMNTLYAGPRGVARAGEQITVPSEEASQLLAGGYAETATAPSDVERRVSSSLPPTPAPGAAKPARPSKTPKPKPEASE